MKHPYTNQLVNESSPYLLQHAHNPVNWYPWGDEALNRAKKENKPIIVSIGYSSCHWCHVMEHESFEDEEVASIMNENFVCIKVDREEHPDVDQIYMNAVQIISGRGGWPLNCFALPDGRPFFGGTYFPKDQWINVLQQVSGLYTSDYQKVLDYTTQLEAGIQQSELMVKADTSENKLSDKTLQKMVNRWESQMDHTHGGPNRTPKFPIPNNYEFLLRYASHHDDEHLLEHVELTLKKMAHGGIYDQVGGGFARYSTDEKWKIPHFEKMLYDNAQLVSLYCHAYQNFKNPLYKQVVIETLSFIEREMTSPEGVFYSALDADSEGEEGKYYVWTKEELEAELGDDKTLFFEYYRIHKDAFWEHGNYILMRTEHPGKLAEKYGLNLGELHHKMDTLKAKLLAVREKRVRPGLDDKSLTSWNAMMIKAYVDAYMALEDPSYLETAFRAADLIEKKFKKADGALYHTYKNGKAKINGLLDDYACMIDAYISLYSVSLQPSWLRKANNLAVYVQQHFYDEKSGMYFYTSDENEVLVTRKTEVYDNVIPSSNSIMALNLKKLAFYFEKMDFEQISKQMLFNVEEQMVDYGSGYSNWALMLMDFLDQNYEVVVCGDKAIPKLKELQKDYSPNILWAGTIHNDESFSFLKSRFVAGKTWIYVCENNTCQLPVESLAEAKNLLYD
ncbi:thioredoxin domain-containing protein [bacterium]|nr:thioredoxin domain-containing protein [bacterium]